MKNINAVIFFLLFSGIVHSAAAQNTDSLITCAYDAYKQGQFVKGATLLELVITAGVKEPDILYNASCCFALSGRKEKAWKYLEEAVDHGFADAAHMQKDTDLVSLHADPRWKKIIEKIKPKEEEKTIQNNRDALINDINNIAAFLYQYKIRPRSMGGGQNSYLGVVLPDKIRMNSNGTYEIEFNDGNEADITGTSGNFNGTVTVRLDSEGQLSNWRYSGVFGKK